MALGVGNGAGEGTGADTQQIQNSYSRHKKLLKERAVLPRSEMPEGSLALSKVLLIWVLGVASQGASLRHSHPVPACSCPPIQRRGLPGRPTYTFAEGSLN